MRSRTTRGVRPTCEKHKSKVPAGQRAALPLRCAAHLLPVVTHCRLLRPSSSPAPPTTHSHIPSPKANRKDTSPSLPSCVARATRPPRLSSTACLATSARAPAVPSLLSLHWPLVPRLSCAHRTELRCSLRQQQAGAAAGAARSSRLHHTHTPALILTKPNETTRRNCARRPRGPRPSPPPSPRQRKNAAHTCARRPRSSPHAYPATDRRSALCVYTHTHTHTYIYIHI